MEQCLLNAITWLLDALALPEVGLSAIFVIALVSATLLPLGSEPIVFAYVSKAPHLFWTIIAVATVGNTIGGATNYWLGRGAVRAVANWRERQADGAGKRTPGGKWHAWSTRWLNQAGPAALLLSWLPVVGDPLCAVAGYLRLPFWPCVVYMAIGKGVRYTLITATLLWGATFFMR
jgi:membrane protein YqaA with SNARE-associated domain